MGLQTVNSCWYSLHHSKGTFKIPRKEESSIGYDENIDTGSIGCSQSVCLFKWKTLARCSKIHIYINTIHKYCYDCPFIVHFESQVSSLPLPWAVHCYFLGFIKVDISGSLQLFVVLFRQSSKAYNSVQYSALYFDLKNV